MASLQFHMTADLFATRIPRGWLAFELSVLRRLKFSSMINPFTGEPTLDNHVKEWGIRVAVNDMAQWSWIQGVARIENSLEMLTREDVEQVLEDAYVPHHRLENPALKLWFGETDAWWFDNVRRNASRLKSDIKRALALTLGMMTGDYALSFTEETREFREPFSRVFSRLWGMDLSPSNNGQSNTSSNREARNFIADQRCDLLFLRLPGPERSIPWQRRFWSWREEWIRGGGDFWNDFERKISGRLGARVETKTQYLRLLQELLETASHLPQWAIAFKEDGFVTSEDLAETVRQIRKVDAVYTKDFSEITTRAGIITAIA